MSERLTKPQRDLLDEIREAGTLYIRDPSRWFRTVKALERKGYVWRSEPDYSSLNMTGYSIVEVQTEQTEERA